jgi:perosamine synthetase
MAEELVKQCVDAVRQVIGTADEMVLLHRPYFPPKAWDYVKECIDTGWVSSAGAFVGRFEDELVRFTGSKRAVAVVNGTAALQVCLSLAGVGRDDEVICPSLSFIATANAISHCGAVPHFVDVSFDRLSLCPVSLQQHLEKVVERRGTEIRNRVTGRRIAAVVLMHCFGLPGAIDEVSAVCDEFGLPLIEDAAESLGSYYKGKHTGRFGKLSAVSFNGNKIITTGGGGAILTDDDELANRAKHLTTTAKVPHRWEFEHDAVGWNYRLPNINAALGCSQLEVLPELLAAKQRLATHYAEAFNAIPGVRFIGGVADGKSNNWLNGFVVESGDKDERDAILGGLNEARYQSRPLWQPMHFLKMYANCPRGCLEVTEKLYRSVINIPSSPDLCLGK